MVRVRLKPTPGDNWDYDATQPLIQADLNIGGRVRNVLMQANKNGFFYVLDRKTRQKDNAGGRATPTSVAPRWSRPCPAPRPKAF
jgi:quinohemoprotein ethanol dehydrogenase